MIQGDGFSMERITQKFSQRMTFKFEADGKQIVNRGEMARDGRAWENDLSLSYVRLA